MVTRHHYAINDPSLSLNVRKARQQLVEKGWTFRGAARHLGYSWNHFINVLTGRRQSRRLLAAIAALPNRPR